MRLLGEEGVVLTRAGDDEYVVYTEAEGVVIEKVSIRRAEGSYSGAVSVDEDSATVKDCDLRGTVIAEEGAKLLLQKCTVHDCTAPAVVVDGIAVIQDSIVQDSPGAGILVHEPFGGATITGTTVRRCQTGLFVTTKATIAAAAPSRPAQRAASTPGRRRAGRAR